jgi:hypothetical protein
MLPSLGFDRVWPGLRLTAITVAGIEVPPIALFYAEPGSVLICRLPLGVSQLG